MAKALFNSQTVEAVIIGTDPKYLEALKTSLQNNHASSKGTLWRQMWSSGKNLNDGCLCKLLTVKLQMRYYTQKVAFALAAAAVLSVLLINSISTSLCDSGFAFQSVGWS